MNVAQVLKNNPNLIPYSVTLTENPGDGHTIRFDCFAEDDDHAIEQTMDAYPHCVITDVTFFPRA